MHIFAQPPSPETARRLACDARRFFHAHHVQHWGHHGETAMENLLMLCSKHHRLVHEGGFTVEGAPGAWVFRRPDGLRGLDRRPQPNRAA